LVTQQSYDLSDLSILVVDDSPFMRELISSMLHNLGVGRIVDVASGQAAVDAINTVLSEGRMNRQFDVIFSDWLMEKMDGLQLLRWVRSHPNPDVKFMPFIMVSAYSTLDWVIMARDNGVSEFLTKPVSVKSMVSRLTSIIEHPRSFINSKVYFGPDRRRKTMEYHGEERRRKK
jgi:two-component system chemotaxis response regulator CheY